MRLIGCDKKKYSNLILTCLYQRISSILFFKFCQRYPYMGEKENRLSKVHENVCYYGEVNFIQKIL